MIMLPPGLQTESAIIASVPVQLEHATMEDSTQADYESSSPISAPEQRELREGQDVNSNTDNPKYSTTKLNVASNSTLIGDQTSTSTTTPQTNHGMQSWKSWIAEIAWLVFSVGLLISIAVVLSSFNNETIPTLPLKISLNTVLAFLATLAKTALMAPVVECVCQLKWVWFSQPRHLDDIQVFEDASRGSWGSIVLLYRHWKYELPSFPKEPHGFRLTCVMLCRSLASIGAIITIVGLVTTPVTQLMITYPTRDVSTAAPATVPIIDFFSPKFVDSYSYDESSFQNAVVQGLSASWSDPKIKPADATCGSSNCTFSDVTSLAICSDVRDITDSGYLQTSFIPDPDITDISFPAAFAGSEYTEGLTAYNMSISDEFTTNCSFITQDPYSLFTCKFRPNKTIAFENERNKVSSLLYSTVIIYAERSKNHSSIQNQTRSDLEFRAMEAILYLCVNRYDVSVSRGNTSTSLRSTTQRIVPQEPPIIVNTTCYIDNMLLTQWCDLGHNSSYANGNFSMDPALIFLQDDSNNSTKFGADVYLLETVANYIYPQFTVFISLDPDRPNIQQEYTAYNAGQALNMLEAVMGAIGLPEQQLANIRVIVDNVAVSLTNQMRISSPQFGLQELFVAKGTAWVSETFVEIRWGWFAFLVTEVTLSTIFVLATIARTKTLALQPIKSSPLAMLVALSQESHVSLGGMGEERVLRRRAREVYAQLQDGELVIMATKD
ncbi:hypothetical protein HD806DRAFT_545450 [Xylariaceae sp. AK1471]|nr:hypothetical protein HD806DRAFT_545450 [Xylariaceae sp. AK1471]